MATPIEWAKGKWNAFLGRDPTEKINNFFRSGNVYTQRPDRFHYRTTSAKAVVAKIYNRIALDVAAVSIVHAKTDADGNYLETVKSGLNECLTLSANIDQTGMAFIKDAVQSMFDEGVVALVPIITNYDPTGRSDSYDIENMRVGRIVAWYPAAVDVEVYNETTGQHQVINLPKKAVAIIENPFYSVMNEPNSTLQSLLRTIRKLDAWNDQNASGKLDLIIQLPYVIKSEQRRKEADKRRKDLEDQMTGSQLGIGYIDGTEKVVQLNRSLENNLWTQVKELTTQLYNELGLTEGVIDGSADEQASINYYYHTISPICSAICDEMKRKFLSKTARTQGQSILFFRDPFKLVPVAQLADIGDKFRRNEIMTSNELRSKLGLKPIQTEDAESLRNPNLNKSAEEVAAEEGVMDDPNAVDDSMTEDPNTMQQEEPEDNEDEDQQYADDFVNQLINGGANNG